MGKLEDFARKAFTSVTIMVIPHSKVRPLRIKISAVGLFGCFLLSIVGACYVLSVGVRTAEYYGMRRRLTKFSSQVAEMKVVLTSLKKTEGEFDKLVSLKSKKKILDQVESDSADFVDIDLLKKQVNEAIDSVSEIREYLKEEKARYKVTPAGWPVKGQISSPFGERIHPITGRLTFHSGIDIRTPPGTPVKATADGIVSFSNWQDGTGYVVIVEHGLGFSTVYAHNKLNCVKVGQRVKRGEVISISGSTGATTGPHVHYEVWKNGNRVDPATFLRDIT